MTDSDPTNTRIEDVHFITTSALRSPFRVEVVHQPSGLSAEATDRSFLRARERALRELRTKVERISTTNTTDPWTICVDALRSNWVVEIAPAEVVEIMFTALDEEGDTTVLRTSATRAEAEGMVGMVFADIGDEEGGCDYGAVVSNALRAIEKASVTMIELGTLKCGACGQRMTQQENPVKGSDSWFYRCPIGHRAWIGK